MIRYNPKIEDGLTTEQVKLLRQAMNDTLYSDSSLDETINSLRDELLNLTVALEKQNGEIKLYNEKISIAKTALEQTPRRANELRQKVAEAKNLLARLS